MAGRLWTVLIEYHLMISIILAWDTLRTTTSSFKHLTLRAGTFSIRVLSILGIGTHFESKIDHVI